MSSTTNKKSAFLVCIGGDEKQKSLISKFAKKNQLKFTTYTETEWATLEEIDQYIHEEDLSKQIINLPIGSNDSFSLDKIQEKTIKKVTQIKKININEAAKRLKIGRATLYRKLEKYGLSHKKKRENKNKAA
ncbi:MAG: hypothetical protein OXC37_03575 [Bdellovibrionaceae bacterium]|nr:hypothetical protein [Pseudobdellovibrionaceae bacterium]